MAAGVVPQSSCSLSGAGLDHFLQRGRARGVALAGETEIDGERVRRLDHAAEMPRARRAGGGVGAGGRPGATAEHRGDARHQRLVDLLRADEMDVAVETAGGENFSFAGDDLGAGADDDGDARLNVGIARFADGRDIAVLDADVGFDDAPVIQNQRIGDHSVDGALLIRDLRLAHAVADHLAAAELHLLAIDGEILFDLDDEIGVGQPHAIADGRPEHVGVSGTFHGKWHDVIPEINNRIFRTLATCGKARSLLVRSPLFGSAEYGWPPWPERAKPARNMGRGCCLQCSRFMNCRSWLSVTGYRVARSRARPGNGSESL
jgi:hypothetical protein